MKQKHISKQVEVAVGDTFTVMLCYNHITVVRWSELAQISDQIMLQQKDDEFVPTEKTGFAGAAGQEVRTFKALKKGTSTVTMEYSRPW